VLAFPGGAYPGQYGSGLAAQLLRATADVQAGEWLPTPLYDEVDEASADVGDFIYSPVAPSGVLGRLRLELGKDPLSSDGHVLRYTISKDLAGGEPVSLTVRLVQDSTVIAQWTHADVPGAWTTYEQALSPAEADAIVYDRPVDLELVAD
jgi:hypothetical protein